MLSSLHLGFTQSKHPSVLRSALADVINNKYVNYCRKTKGPINPILHKLIKTAAKSVGIFAVGFLLSHIT